jgi:N-acetylglucosaminyl-diphospho-decaprenol L-rhamnosyltransferase
MENPTLGSAIEVIVVTRNSAHHIGACVDSIRQERALPVIVDNASSDDTLEIVRKRCPEAMIIASSENLGYGKALNTGLIETTGNFVILSNPDVVFRDGAVAQMANYLEENPRVGVACPQQVFPDGSWQRSYGELPGLWSGIKDATGITSLKNRARRYLWSRKLDRKPKTVPYVDGAVLAVRRRAFQDVDGFDEDFFFYAEEADLCARLKRAGWGVMFLPKVTVMHIRGADSAKKDCSDRFVRLQVAGQYLLASKHLPAWKIKVYASLQVAHFERLRLTYRLLSRIKGSNRTHADKIRMFEDYSRLWKEHREIGRLNQAETSKIS